MDLLYSRYASPVEFMKTYINQGRFGEFVNGILELDAKRKKETAQKENDDKLWLAYIHNITGKSFHDWKNELQQKQEPKTHYMTDEQVDEVIQQAREILKKISPK